MRKIHFLPLVFLFLFALTTNAQEKGQLWYCDVETVLPSSIFDYQQMSKELADLAKENDFPFSFYIWSSRDLDYMIYYPINSLEDIDEINQAWDNMMEKWGKEKSSAFGQTKEGNRSFTFQEDPTLSYLPETSRLDPGDAKYLQYQEFGIIPGKDDELKSVVADAYKLLSDKKYDDAWHMARAGIGMNTPGLISWSFGKDRDDFYAQDKKFQNEFGEAFKPLNKRFISCIKRVKNVELFYQKDFSYEKEN
ncbi:MAG TPA: hypothetical protein VKA27_15640 [Sunxiuqinia sp.]|nr:hypothetical protein [Sunxiuqinia sp.]